MLTEAKRASNRRWRQAHPEQVSAITRAWQLANPLKARAAAQRAYAKRRAVIDAAKDRPCMDCDRRYPSYVMDFDHVRGEKLFGIGTTVAKVSLRRLLDEIAKCDVVCANCHRERTHAR